MKPDKNMLGVEWIFNCIKSDRYFSGKAEVDIYTGTGITDQYGYTDRDIQTVVLIDVVETDEEGVLVAVIDPNAIGRDLRLDMEEAATEAAYEDATYFS